MLIRSFLDNIKLVATDIGGTLARSDGSISNFSIETLRSLQESGIIIALVTGYSKEITDKIASQISDKLVTIIQNGAIIFDGEVLLETNYLNKDIALKVVE
ncbi:MAG: HAD family phosphatase, partial [Candidatus Marinimicrobia bacterium]|nr:HAD family phosphatase [Candidatus Neomarinimicrobiota bacterium]